jgi:23S rRNA pseudouridine1911/1915/1917 synthase
VSRAFVVRDGDGRTVAEALARFGEAAEAVSDGRVFLGKRRVSDPSLAVHAGDELVVEPASAAAEGVSILSEWRGLYAVLKPAGLSTEPDLRGGASLLRAVSEALRVAPEALHAATRLDAPVSGIVVVARGAEAARLVAALKGEGRLGRRYLGLASGTVEPPSGTWEAPIGTGPRGRATVGGRDARPATTRYRRIATAPAVGAVRAALLRLEPVTGRTHQLRLHAAAAGAPLLGDASHGGPRRVVLDDGRVVSLSRVALHAAQVVVTSGASVEWTVTAPEPADLVSTWVDLGGAASSFADALLPSGAAS